MHHFIMLTQSDLSKEASMSSSLGVGTESRQSLLCRGDASPHQIVRIKSFTTLLSCADHRIWQLWDGITLASQTHKGPTVLPTCAASTPSIMAPKKIPAFFVPGPPPPVWPMLTILSDLKYLPRTAPTVTLTEGVDRLSTKGTPGGPVRTATLIAGRRARSSSPYPLPRDRTPNKVTFTPPNVITHDDAGSELTELSDSEGLPTPQASESATSFKLRQLSSAPSERSMAMELEEGPIPKPPGEAGRPGRGGYNLDDAVQMDPEVFTEIKVRVLRQSHSYILIFASSTGVHAQVDLRTSRRDEELHGPIGVQEESCPG